MKTFAPKSQAVTQQPIRNRAGVSGFVDNRPLANAQRELQARIGESPQVRHAVQFQARANEHQRSRALPGSVSIPTQGGVPLTTSDRARMEPALGADFSTVRIYRDSSAARALGALAFARGEDVHFAAGADSQRTLGHELAHVVQQRQQNLSTTRNVGGVPINDDPALEAAADRMATRNVGERGSRPLAAGPRAPTAQPIQRLIQNEVYNAPFGASAEIQAPRTLGAAPAAVQPPGWCLDADAVNNPLDQGQTKPHHHERGHLIGRQFGGIGGATNLVTLTQKSNGGPGVLDMLYHETRIENHVDANPGTLFTYQVTPIYNPGFNYSHLGNVDPGLVNHVYIRDPAPEFIQMTLTDPLGVVAYNGRADNGEMYAQHLY